MERSDPRLEPGTAAPPPAGYAFVEGRHLRQWAARAVLPLGVAAANGAGFVDLAAWDLAGWPRHDLPIVRLGWPAWSGAAAPIAGGVLIALAVVFRVTAKGVLVRKTEVSTGGVYRWCRHPFYVAVLAGGVGTLLLAGPLGALVAAFWLVVALPVHVVTIAGEESGLAALHGAVWTRYAAEVPRLLPWRGAAGPPPDPPTRVTWANLVFEREPPRLLRFLGSAAIVLGAATAVPLGFVVAGFGVLLHALSHILPGGRRPAGARPAARAVE